MINKDSQYFREAAAMLGECEAERHLLIAQETTDCGWNEPCDVTGESEPYDVDVVNSCSLNSMFTWGQTAQGHEFWDLICNASDVEWRG